MAQLLYRTNIALTGNAKLGVWLGKKQSIDHCALAPVSSGSSIVPSKVNFNSTLGHDLSQFYKTHGDIFYSPQIADEMLGDYPYKTLTNSDYNVNPFIADAQYGLKRVSMTKNKKQFSVFAPVFVKSASDIPAGVEFIIQTGVGAREDLTPEMAMRARGQKNFTSVSYRLTQPRFIRKVTVDIKDTKLGEYLTRSYRGVNGYNSDGSDIQDMHIINVNPKSDYALTRGWSMETGGVCDARSDLMNKLFINTLTFQEFNSRICDEYRNFKMTCPWILNLCWYFNLEDLLTRVDIPYGQVLKIDVNYIDNDGNTIPRADLDTNFRLISPKSTQTVETEYGEVEQMPNVLEYDKEWSCDELWNDTPGHLVPITNTWALSGSYNSYIFNVFPGFDDSDIELDAPFSQNSYDTTPNRISNNTKWLRKILSTKCKSSNINNIIYDGSVRDMYYDGALPRCQDYKGSIICNGNKYDIDYDKVKKTIKAIDGKEYGFTQDQTRWSMSISYNNTSINDTAKWLVIYTTNKSNIDNIDIILWMPSPWKKGVYDDFNGLVLRNVKEKTLKTGDMDVYFLNATADKQTQWKSYSVNSWSLTDWMTYIEPSAFETKDTLYSYKTSDKYIIPYYHDTQFSTAESPMKCEIDRTELLRVSDPEYMHRYFGWIQPRLIEINPIKYKNDYGNVVYEREFSTKDKNTAQDLTWDPVCVKCIDDYKDIKTRAAGISAPYYKWGDGCTMRFVQVPYDYYDTFKANTLSAGEFAYDFFIFSRLYAGLPTNGIYPEKYGEWGGLEWKCFDWSQCVLLPPTMTVTKITTETLSTETIGDALKAELMRVCKIGFDKSTAYIEKFLNRMINKYNYTVDVDIDKHKYIITFNLK